MHTHMGKRPTLAAISFVFGDRVSNWDLELAVLQDRQGGY